MYVLFISISQPHLVLALNINQVDFDIANNETRTVWIRLGTFLNTMKWTKKSYLELPVLSSDPSRYLERLVVPLQPPEYQCSLPF